MTALGQIFHRRIHASKVINTARYGHLGAGSKLYWLPSKCSIAADQTWESIIPAANGGNNYECNWKSTPGTEGSAGTENDRDAGRESVLSLSVQWFKSLASQLKAVGQSRVRLLFFHKPRRGHVLSADEGRVFCTRGELT